MFAGGGLFGSTAVIHVLVVVGLVGAGSVGVGWTLSVAVVVFLTLPCCESCSPRRLDIAPSNTCDVLES